MRVRGVVRLGGSGGGVFEDDGDGAVVLEIDEHVSGEASDGDGADDGVVVSVRGGCGREEVGECVGEGVEGLAGGIRGHGGGEGGSSAFAWSGGEGEVGDGEDGALGRVEGVEVGECEVHAALVVGEDSEAGDAVCGVAGCVRVVVLFETDEDGEAPADGGGAFVGCVRV